MDSSEVRRMSPEEKEAFHLEAEARMQPIKFAHPDSGRPKDVLMLTKTPRLRTLVQIVKDGGENNLHYHTNSDTCWMVLKGRVRFYGLGDKLIDEYGPRQGILIPEGSRYWFEKAGDEVLELLQVVGVDTRGGKSERINLTQHKEWMKDYDGLLTIDEKTMAATEVKNLSPEQKEAWHREAESRMQPIKYTAPNSGRPKDIVPLAKTPRLRANVQIVHEGGENNLHYHTGADTSWVVVQGRVRFYGVGDRLIGEYGPGEGLMIPEGSRYWFEKTGSEDLEILQIVATDMRGSAKSERINLEKHKEWMTGDQRLTTYE